MVDLHCHVLPGIDDGARSLAESAQMCALAWQDGCSALVATPHQRHDLWPNDDHEKLNELCAQVRKAAPKGLEILLGAEIRVDGELLAELVQPLRAPLAVAGTRHLLLELDRREPPKSPDAASLVHELVVAGWWPIFAHPELTPWLAEDLDEMARLIDRGARFQITAMSITGEFGRWAHENSAAILKAGLAHFVASDSHGTAHRPPGLSKARRTLAERWGEDVAERLTTTNPTAVLADQPVPAVMEPA